MMEQLLNFFIPTAHAADAATASPQGGGFSLIFMFVIFFVFVYFAIWRPQSKRAKEQANMMGALANGDEVITVGGLVGKIIKISDQYITVSIANNVEIIMQKSAVANVLPKGTIKTIG